MTSIVRPRKTSVKMNFVRNDSKIGISIPGHFQCPISLELMKDPVTLSTGITYDRQSIERWLETGGRTCPVSNKVLKEGDEEEEMIPNHSIRRMIQDWCVANKAYGIERIPTPRTPVTPEIVEEMLSKIRMASREGDRNRCSCLVQKMVVTAKESQRNRRLIREGGAAQTLSMSFENFAGVSVESLGNGVSEEILSALTLLFPLDKEVLRHVGSPESMNCIISILNFGSLTGRLNAALVVKELVSSGREYLIAETQGLVEALTKLIREPVSPQTTKVSLIAVFYMVRSDEKVASQFADMNLASLIVEKLVDSDRSMCEKSLAVLDGVFGSENGREKGCKHALTVPVLVKKMFRVSEMATEFAVSALWRLCKNMKGDAGEVGCLIEAVQVGAFQKLLLLLQVGCSEGTKEKASELLKLMNGYREWECIETMDFKGLKRPF